MGKRIENQVIIYQSDTEWDADLYVMRADEYGYDYVNNVKKQGDNVHRWPDLPPLPGSGSGSGSTAWADITGKPAEVVKLNSSSGNITAAATTDLGALSGDTGPLIGATPITSFGIADYGVERKIICGGGNNITYNATTLIVPGSANIVTAAEDVFVAKSFGSGNWQIIDYQKRDGTPLISQVAQTITNGVTATAPSQDAVFDAMALKADTAATATAIATKGLVYFATIDSTGVLVNDPAFNQLGGTPVWTNPGGNNLTLTITGAFPVGRTKVEASFLGNNGSNGTMWKWEHTSVDAINFYTFDQAGDAIEANPAFFVSITVYPAP